VYFILLIYTTFSKEFTSVLQGRKHITHTLLCCYQRRLHFDSGFFSIRFFQKRDYHANSKYTKNFCDAKVSYSFSLLYRFVIFFS